MLIKASDLKQKEVINMCDGRRLGSICDFEINMPSGQICAVYVPGPAKWYQLMRPQAEYEIPWSCVKRIGDDVVLVELEQSFFIKYGE